MLHVLLTGIGAPGTKGTIHCLRQNPDKIPIHIVGIDIDPHAVGQCFVERFYSAPSPESNNYLDFIKKIIAGEKIQVVIPQTSRETLLYSKYTGVFESLGVKVLVVSENAAQLANNKYFTLSAFETAKLPVSKYYLVKNKNLLDEALVNLNYPTKKVVVKLPVANGMRGIRILSEERLTLKSFENEKPNGDQINSHDFFDMLSNAVRFPEMLVMEYLPGDEYSVDVFRNQHEICIIPRLRKKIRSGISFENEIVQQNEIISISAKAAQAMNLHGVFGFQYKLDENNMPKILECNARIQGTMVASYFANANIIWYGVADKLGMPFLIQKNIHWNTTFLRYWGGASFDTPLKKNEII